MTRSFPPEAPRNCTLCPRLATYIKEVDQKEPSWFNGAVPSFGPETAELLVIGLAPGVTGANRTGRPFTGDWAGDLLYATLAKFGLSNDKYDQHPDDGLELKRTMITNAVRCVPPQNKPIGAEINQCRAFLTSRIHALPGLKAMICLGKISHDSTVRALGLKLKDHPFGHGTHYQVTVGKRPVHLISSYHCSRYNTNTKRLTEEMFEDIFASALGVL